MGGFINKSKTINLWIQSIAIVVAGLWAVNVFMFEKIWMPFSAPAALNVEVSLKKISSNADKTTVEICINLNNPNVRKQFVLPSIFIVYGNSYSNNELTNFKDAYINEELNIDDDSIISGFERTKDQDIISVGKIYGNWVFEPNEKATRTYIVEIPNKYSNIECYTRIITTDKKYKDISLKWQINQDDSVEYKIEKLNNATNIPDDIHNKLGNVTNTTMLSL